MAAEVVEPATQFHAELRVPGDKSIAHRALLFAATAEGESRITGLPDGADVAATAACLAALGVPQHREGDTARVQGGGLEVWQPPADALDCANSGTTMRLLAGLLAGSHATATLQGDASLQRRPMERVAAPLRRMGAEITTTDGRPPIFVRGRQLTGVDHRLERPSAQVKSALLLAGLQAHGTTSVSEPVRSRDHTERLLAAMGAHIGREGDRIRIEPLRRPLDPIDLSIPGDFSSAAFLLGAAAMRPGWTATIHDVGLNPTRTAFLELLRAMGAQVEVAVEDAGALEPRGRVTVVGGELRAITCGGELVSRAIDEIPILLAVASQARGVTRVTDAGELRVKESDRLTGMAGGLRRMGAQIEERRESITIEGPAALNGATVDAGGDHRIAMALAVAALSADGPTQIQDGACVAVSYPGFFEALRAAAGR